MEIESSQVHKLRIAAQIACRLLRSLPCAEPEVFFARDLRLAAVNIKLSRKLINNVVAQPHDQTRRTATHAECSARSIGVAGVIGRAVIERVIENLDRAAARAAVVGYTGHIDAGESAPALQW